MLGASVPTDRLLEGSIRRCGLLEWSSLHGIG
jgi:hypothetical protein